MKNGRKPTYEQRKLIQGAGLDSYEWLVVKDTSTELVVVYRHTEKTTRTIYKRG